MDRGRKPRSRKQPGVQIALARMDKAIKHCRSALLSPNMENIERDIKFAKKSYAAALRIAWRIALTKEAVQALDYKSTQLEEVISRLEARYKLMRADYYASKSRKNRTPSV
jgi:hypothetical protein